MPRHALFFAFAPLLLLMGCAQTERTKGPTRPAFAVVEPDTSLTVKSAQVFVEGKYKNTTPAVVHVRRGFGERLIILRQDKDTVRTFEVEFANSSSASDLRYSIEGQGTLDLLDLNVTRDSTFIIPYTPNGIVVEDREYGLTLVVGN